MDASTIDEDVDLATHGLEGAREESAHSVEVREIAFDNLDGPPKSLDGMVRLEVGRTRALHEAEGRACLGEGYGAGCPDA